MIIVLSLVISLSVKTHYKYKSIITLGQRGDVTEQSPPMCPQAIT